MLFAENISWASHYSVRRHNINPQSGFTPLSDSGVATEFYSEAKIITALKLFLSGKNCSDINGMLLESDASNVDTYDSGLEFTSDYGFSSNRKVFRAKFISGISPGVLFQLEYFDSDEKRDTNGTNIAVKRIVWNSIFKKDDCVVISTVPEEKNTLLQSLAKKWDALMDLGGVFRYTLEGVSRRQVGRFFAMYNSGRSGRRPVQMETTSLFQPFQPEKFNFNKVNEKEVLVENMNFDGVTADILVNLNPIMGRHVLIIPERKRCHNQYFNLQAAIVALGMVERIGKASYKVMYNSVGAFASINHLHLQAFEYDKLDGRYPVEIEFADKDKRVLISEKNGVSFYELPDWIINTMVLHGSNKAEMINQLILITGELNKRQHPYNIVFTYDGTNYKSYIFPRKLQGPTRYGGGIAFLEAVGEMTFGNQEGKTVEESKEIFEQVTEDDIITEVSAFNFDRDTFLQDIAACKAAINSTDSEDYPLEKYFSSIMEKDLVEENDDKKLLIINSARYLRDYPVNMYIDLSSIPKSGEQLEENMETLASVIAWHNRYGLNIRYALENDVTGEALCLLKEKVRHLKPELVDSIGHIYVSGDTIKTTSGKNSIVSPENLIEIKLRDIKSIDRNYQIKEREYLIALKENISETIIPNYPSAAIMGLSLAALRIAGDKLSSQSIDRKEYEKFRGKIAGVFKSIYSRHNLINDSSDFSVSQLELMVSGNSITKMYYTFLYALPPLGKFIEDINKYHSLMRDVLIAA